MAAFDTTRPQVAAPRGRSVLANVIGAFVAWNDARATRRALSQLSAHELDDIGLTRSDIDVVASRGINRINY